MHVALRRRPVCVAGDLLDGPRGTPSSPDVSRISISAAFIRRVMASPGLIRRMPAPQSFSPAVQFLTTRIGGVVLSSAILTRMRCPSRVGM